MVLDHENPGSSPSHDAAWALTWLKRVESKLGFKPLVYTYISFAKEGRCNGLGGYKLWLADPSSDKGHPRVPAPWTSAVMHQWGTVNKVDADVFFGDLNAFHALGKPGASKPVMPTLKLGAKGTVVKTLQTALNKHGGHVVVDSSFGPVTDKAVRAFQKTAHLTTDGVVGPKTWKALGY